MKIGQEELLKITTTGIKYDLTRTKKLLQICGNPQLKTKTIQVVGTNGKGSTAAFLSKIIENNKYKVGLYTSPHLSDYRERIRINSKKISSSYIRVFLDTYKERLIKEKASFFELMTVISMWYFKKKEVDIAILETGLGGRLDSVTACDNICVVFTPISMDHHAILGNSLYAIAAEKAGAIINKNQICISSPQHHQVKKALLKQAKKTENKILFIEHKNKSQKNIKLEHLMGKHQLENALLSKEVACCINKKNIININNKTIYNAINDTKWPGRFQTITTKPNIIYDVAHNTQSLKALINNLTNIKNVEKKYLICGFEHNKKIKQTLPKAELFFDQIVCTEAGVRKSMPADKIKSFFSKNTNVIVIKKVELAIKQTIKKTQKNDLIVIAGSHFFAPTLDKMFKNCFAMY